MAKISYEAYQSMSTEQEYTGGGVGFFSLKNDGDEAIVRIMHDSPADYDILSTHSVKVGDRYTKVECLNEGANSSLCPMCKSGAKLQYRFFVHMIQYVKDEQGNIISKPVVWDRSAKDMAAKLNAMLQEYGPLSDCIFKVRRNGKAGDMKTTYEIMFANPNVYRPDLYPNDTEVFKSYTASGKQVMNKTAEEMEVFLATGNFPEKNTVNSNAEATRSYATEETVPTANYGVNTATNQVTNAQAGARPNRYY